MLVRRRNGLRVSAIGLAGVLAGTTLAGCGTDTKKDPGAASVESSGATNAPKSPGASEDGTAAVRSASDKTNSAGTAKMVLRTQVTTQGKTVSVDGKGLIDLKNGTSTMTLTADGEQIEQRVVDQVLYQKLPPKAREGVPGKKPWIKMDLKKLSAQNGSNPQVSDPAANTAFAKSVMDKDVTKVGTEQIGDANTTHYKVKVDVSKLQNGAQLQKVVGPTLPMDLWIDDEGRIRRQQIDMTMTQPKGQGAGSGTPQKVTSRTVFELSDFGAEVKAEAPPAAETADMTDKAAQQGKKQS
ncbi:hypothetical protein [Streptomyces sp. NPDC058657]|uniref:hypothetical protein n=1 Tax=unclassified Streptomyces TaxID=2593676 RepID=UPI00365F1B0C